jgi:uncharacterized repeat protein (TIGR01451 family)
MRRNLVVFGVGVAILAGLTYGVSPDREAEAQGQIEGCSVIFNFSGTSIDFNVPDRVERVELDIYGAAGGDATGAGQSNNIGQGGLGAGVQNAILGVTPGDELTVIVGGEGGPAEGGGGGSQLIAGGVGGFGYDGTPDGGQSGGRGGDATGYHGGGGGGGASAVLLNGEPVAAAGGGGGGAHGGFGGDGGTVGENGTSTGTGLPNAFGVGATQTAGGAGGIGQHGGLDGVAGVQGAGGAGGAALNTAGGDSSPGGDAGGGGGGGLFGGGGAGGSGASNPGGGAGGGGGSSLTTIDEIDDGQRDGDGQIVITLDQETCPGDLAIDKSVSDRRPEVGDRITYTLEATNNGPVDPDTGVVVTDRLPPEVEYLRDDCERGRTNSNRPGIWRWRIGRLALDETVTCEITVRVAHSGRRIRNTAVIDGNNPDRNPDNNDDDANIRVPRLRYDLELVKDVAPTEVLVGDQVTYTLSATNLGPDRSEATGVVDLLPPEVSYVSDTCDGSLHNANPAPITLPNRTVDLPAGTYWVWRLGELRPERTQTCQITVTVLQPGEDILNQAAVISHGVECCERFRNNVDDAVIDARVPQPPPLPPVPPGTPSADLAIEKTGPATVDQGARFSWTMTVTNNGPQASSGTTVTDQIPAGVLRPRTSTPGCEIADRRLECQIGELAVGDSTRIELSGRAPLRQGCVTNPAGVSGNEIDTDPTNNNDTAETCTGGQAPQLGLTKSTRRNIVRAGEVFAYRIVVRNTGDGPARRVRVCDEPSADLTIVRAPGAEEVGQRRACWDVRLLRAGGRRVFAVIAQVVAGADPGVKPNTATATASNVSGSRRSTARVRVRPPGAACPAATAHASC